MTPASELVTGTGCRLSAILLLAGALGLGCASGEPRGAMGPGWSERSQPQAASSAVPPPTIAIPPATAAMPPTSATAAVAPAEPERVTFLAVGDLLLSRGVAARIAKTGDVLLPFRAVAPLLASVDFTVANLEAPFSASDRFSTSSANVFNTPVAHLQGLVDHRVRVLALANNHALDQGPAALAFTLDLLAARGLQPFGVGKSTEEAWAGTVAEVRGVRIGFVGASYASVNDNGTLRNRYVARLDEEQQLERAIARHRPNVDLLVVTMHAGAEYHAHVVPSQTRFAHRAIELGADLVLGAHPHVLQRFERYQGKPIFYSLGNFIFDHEPLDRRQGLAVKVELTRPACSVAPADDCASRKARLSRLEAIGVIIEGGCCPRLATAGEQQTILGIANLPSAVLEP